MSGPTVIYADPDDGHTVVPETHDLATSTRVGELVLVATPCPNRRMGGAGGQVVTSCAMCGEAMGSTGGTPHNGWRVVPMVVAGRSPVGDRDDAVMIWLRWFQPEAPK